MHQSEPRSGLERGKKHTRHTGSGVWSQEITSFCILLACGTEDSRPAGLTSARALFPRHGDGSLSRPELPFTGGKLYFVTSLNHCRLDS
jgi:hypothetical protein